MTHTLLYLSFAIILGIGMAWSVGANDLANVMSTTMGSKAITVKQAVIIAIVFEFAGALLGGHGVANTIRDGILNTEPLNIIPDILILGMLGVLLATTSWMILASFLGMPVSVTQSTVGAILGFGLVVLGAHAIHWRQVGYILASWVISPSTAGIAAYLLFQSVQHFILGKKQPLIHAKRIAPIYLFTVGYLLSIMTVLKALDHLQIHRHFLENLLITTGTSLIILFIGNQFFKRITQQVIPNHHGQFKAVEKMFGVLMVITASAMVFAHGSNDVAIAVGPMAAVISLVNTGGTGQDGPLLFAILTMGCAGVVVGFLMYGRKVIITVGSGITSLTPSRAFCATIAAATTVVISTSIGIPVSATQTLVGAVLGVGLARGIGALDLRVVRNIFMSWIITLPISATLSILYFYLFRGIFL